MFGKLYIVATPIGNMADITNRALDILRGVDLILTEDTRVTGKLLERYSIVVKVSSYHHHSSDEKKLMILKKLIDGHNLALVSDAGTPGISDPGNELIDYLQDKEPKIEIVPIPGASALTAAVSVCGFYTKEFVFIGFMPKKKRTKLISEIEKSGRAFVFFESPKRVIRTLETIKEIIGDRRVFVGRELTKIHEETTRGNIAEVIAKLRNSDERGEMVLVVEGK